MKHTPGPWQIPDWRQLGKIDVCATGGVVIASVHLQSDPVEEAEGWPTEESNAQLIASAPELLAACEQVQAWLLDGKPIADDGVWHPLFIKANNLVHSAIAKATGATS